VGAFSERVGYQGIPPRTGATSIRVAYSAVYKIGGSPVPGQTQTVPQRACRSAWAKLITKVYEVDPLVCCRCGSAMTVIAVITDPPEVRKILRHLVRIGRAPPGLDPSSLN
jgi:hypothetical protein